ncbi:hypothetical protein N7541_008561 [Penicillium brevicompactum]|uniref:Uncharacterized protein n=1 Tax=Penicillium brevicompactum TaxID=5074 RepID=A0A9W9R1J6_PENBR|nr:hypothetical protein N7541_008561 [Penicillium brevicompactum]
MKQLYHGPQYGISTETMSYTQVSLHPPAPTTAQRTFLVSIDAQVCHEHSSLVLRIQQIVFVSKSRRFLLYSNTRYAPWGRTWKRKSEPLGLFVCHHISDHELAGLITQSVNTYRTGNDRETVSPTYLCKQCKVDFCIEVSEHGTDIALVITRWLELENDLTPRHPHRLRHAQKPRNSPRETRNASINPTGEQVGARFCFEEATPRPLRQLISRNIYCLKDQRYKQPLYQFMNVERFGLWYKSKELVSYGSAT